MERDTAIDNAEKIRSLGLKTPIIYAGNIENREEMKLIFDEESGQKLYNVENVYPKIDDMNVEPCRKVIQDAFEDHITNAPGMEHVREMINGPIIPTPGAVMQATRLLHECLGNVMVIDVGGATTDVHSVARESDNVARILTAPEPLAKRTVEGDLGVLSVKHHDSAVKLLEKSLGFKFEKPDEDEFDIKSTAVQHVASESAFGDDADIDGAGFGGPSALVGVAAELAEKDAAREEMIKHILESEEQGYDMTEYKLDYGLITQEEYEKILDERAVEEAKRAKEKGACILRIRGNT